MANTRLIFIGTENTRFTQLECFDNSKGEIYIQIENTDGPEGYNLQFITLDKETAIELSRVLNESIENPK